MVRVNKLMAMVSETDKLVELPGPPNIFYLSMSTVYDIQVGMPLKCISDGN